MSADSYWRKADSYWRKADSYWRKDLTSKPTAYKGSGHKLGEKPYFGVSVHNMQYVLCSLVLSVDK